MRVLSIDPALRNTGYAVLETQGRTIKALGYGTIRNAPAKSQSRCLVSIRSALQEIIAEFSPAVCAIEAVIYVQNFRTAISLGAARGAAILAAAEAGLEIFEYPPRRVKQAVVGKGAAGKQQVAFMVRSLLSLTETPPADAADAIAIGITHLQSNLMNRVLGKSTGKI